MLAAVVQQREAIGLQKAEAGIGGGEEETLLAADREVAERAGGQPTLEEGFAPADETEAEGLLILHDVSSLVGITKAGLGDLSIPPG